MESGGGSTPVGDFWTPQNRGESFLCSCCNQARRCAVSEMTPTAAALGVQKKDDCKMQTAPYRDNPAVFLRSMALVAVGSFVAGFGGFLVIGLIG